MNLPQDHRRTDPFQAFKKAALVSLLWGCAGSFMLGVVVGSILYS